MRGRSPRAGRRDRDEHAAARRIDLMDVSFRELEMCGPSNAVPACAATSIGFVDGTKALVDGTPILGTPPLSPVLASAPQRGATA